MTEKKKSICPVLSCGKEKHRRYFLCAKCWDKLPKDLKLTIREYSRDGKKERESATMQSLRAFPTENWLEHAIKHIGTIRRVMTWGHGISAVKVREETAA